MSGTSAAGSASCGTFSSSTMIVMITAMTPSLNASSRALFMTRASCPSTGYLSLSSIRISEIFHDTNASPAPTTARKAQNQANSALGGCSGSITVGEKASIANHMHVAANTIEKNAVTLADICMSSAPGKRYLNGPAAGSDDIQMLDSRGNVAILRFLGVQLDIQAQVVDRVGVSQRVLVADPARLEQVEQRLVEGLHAELARLLHDLLDLVHLALEYQVGNERGIEHDLDGGAAALALLQGDEALGDHSAQVQGEVHQQLRSPLLGKEVDDAIQRLVGAVRVQRREAQVAGLGEGDRVLHGLAVADLADEDDVRRLAQRVLEGGRPGHRVDAHLALGDEAAPVRVRELDRVLDGDDMAVRVLVAETDHGRERRRFSGARGAHHDHQAALGHDDVFEHCRQPQLLDLGNGGGDDAQHDADVRLLNEGVDAEAADPGGVDREVALLVLFELRGLPVVHDRAREVHRMSRRQRL